MFRVVDESVNVQTATCVDQTQRHLLSCLPDWEYRLSDLPHRNQSSSAESEANDPAKTHRRHSAVPVVILVLRLEWSLG